MNQLKQIVVPYSFDGILLNAYKYHFSTVEENDWICFMDGDVAFLEMSDFGHVLQEYINAYPETGMFTCYASRCHYSMQKRKGVLDNKDSITYYAEAVIKNRLQLHLKVKPIERRIAGHLIMMKKSTWTTILPTLQAKAKNKKILGFDTKLSYSIMQHGFDIKLMRGVLVFHYLRFLTGKNKFIK